MLRFSSQTIHGIMFPDGRLRQTFFFSFFFSRHSSSKYGHFIFPGPSCSKDGQRYPPEKRNIQLTSITKTNYNIRWLAIYPVDSAIHHLNNCKGPDVSIDYKLKREKSKKKKLSASLHLFASSQANCVPWSMKGAFILDVFSFGQIKAVKKRNFSI